MKTLNYKILALIASLVFFLSNSVLATPMDCLIAFDDTDYWDNVNAIREINKKRENIEKLVATIPALLKAIEMFPGDTLINSFIRTPISATVHAIKALESGKDINHKFDGKPLFHVIVWGGTEYHINLSYELGAEINSTDNEGDTPLHEALQFHNTNAVDTLIKLGADPNAKNNKGDTPLHEAIRLEKKIDVIKTLLKSGADINAQNNRGDTPLHLATKGDDTILITFLTRNGADPYLENNKGRSPMDIAGNKSLLSLFMFTDLQSTMLREYSNFSKR